jgi:Zn-dependent peptidase ImmA (M78 family)
MLEMRLRRSRDEARKLHVRLGVRKPEHIDPVDAARALGIEVVSGHLIEATARIFRAGSRATIRVSDRIVHPGRRRFSIAHELGHQILGHELPGESEISRFVSRACERRQSPNEDPEREADVFATEFLTPEKMTRPYCEVSPVSLHEVRAIERAFGTSPVASALRFVELSSERCAVVY